MSEKEQQFKRIYEKTKDFGRIHFVREIQMQINDNKKKDELIKQLKKQKSDVVKVLKQLKGSARWERHLYEVDYMLEMLGEIDVKD